MFRRIRVGRVRKGLNTRRGTLTTAETKKNIYFFEEQQNADFKEKAWGDASEIYDRSFGNKFRAYAKTSLDYISKNTTRIVDIGCGSGALFDVLKENKFRNVSSYVGVDFSQDMVDVCNSKRGSTDDVASFRVANGEDLTCISTNSKDLAVALFSVIFFPRRNRGLSEMYRVLDHDGIALVSGWSLVKKLEWVYFSNQAMKRVLETYEPERTALKSLTGRQAGVPNFLAWSDPESLRLEMQSANFQDVRTFENTKRFFMPTPSSCESLWRDMSHSFPTIKFLLTELYEHESIIRMFPNNDTRQERKEKFENEIATSFAQIIGERGALSQQDCDEHYGYLDGTAIFGVGYKKGRA